MSTVCEHGISTGRIPARLVNEKDSPSSTRQSSPVPYRASRRDRTSFVSVREDDEGTAQTFLDFPFSTTDDSPSEHAVVDDSPTTSADMATALILRPDPAACCPCGRLDAWKAIRLRGRMMSRSSEDLRSRRLDTLTGHDDDVLPSLTAAAREDDVSPSYPSGRSPLERLPVEILGK